MHSDADALESPKQSVLNHSEKDHSVSGDNAVLSGHSVRSALSVQASSVQSIHSVHSVQPISSIQFASSIFELGQTSGSKSPLEAPYQLKPAIKKRFSNETLNLGAGFFVSDQSQIIIANGRQFSLGGAAQCPRCLRKGHNNKSCSYPIRCLCCYNYGHREKQCLNKLKWRVQWKPKSLSGDKVAFGPKLQWKPKIPLESQPNISGETTMLVDDSHSPREVQQPHLSNSQNGTTPPPLHINLPPTVSPQSPPAFVIEQEQEPDFPPQSIVMANFACDPTPYLPFGAHVENGWQRPARSRVAIGGEPPRCHEEYGIISMDLPPPPALARQALTEVVAFLEANFPVRVFSHFLSPLGLGLGLLEFGSSVHRQSMIDISPFAFNEVTTLRVVKHDEAINHRACPYTRECWIMFLTFPLDYQREEFLDAAIAPFRRRLYWHKGPNKTRTLVHCLMLAPERVPHSVVISRGTTMGGNGRSWSVPTYILGGHFPDGFPGDEDPIPADGNPHPMHGVPLAGNPDNFQNWMHDLVGAGGQVLGDAGLNVQMMQEVNADIVVGQQNEEIQDMTEEMQVDDNVVEHAVPQHPDQP